MLVYEFGHACDAHGLDYHGRLEAGSVDDEGGKVGDVVVLDQVAVGVAGVRVKQFEIVVFRQAVQLFLHGPAVLARLSSHLEDGAIRTG